MCHEWRSQTGQLERDVSRSISHVEMKQRVGTALCCGLIDLSSKMCLCDKRGCFGPMVAAAQTHTRMHGGMVMEWRWNHEEGSRCQRAAAMEGLSLVPCSQPKSGLNSE